MSTPRTLVELFRSRAQERPDQVAYTFLDDDGAPVQTRTYGQVDEEARGIATRLREQVEPGARALLIYPPGVEFVSAVLGCLYAGVIPAPAPPPNPARLARTVPRVQSIATDAGTQVLLSTGFILEALESLADAFPWCRQLRWLATDDESTRAAATAWRGEETKPSDLALLQYTSGSTADPKGVMLSHHNILSNLAYFDLGGRHDASSVMVTWLPSFHDFGLIYGLLQPAYGAFPCFILSPLAVIQSPFRWLSAMTRYRGTHTMGPTFAYELCIRRIDQAKRSQLDLGSWRAAAIAAEPVRVETLRRFHQAFAPSGLRWEAICPGYGLSEGTCKVTTCRTPFPSYSGPSWVALDAKALQEGQIKECPEADPNHRSVVSCGPPEGDTQVLIVDPQTLIRCPPDRVGEVWVKGPGVAVGYWNRPEETARVLEAVLPETGEGPFLRTGDFGFLKDGELYLTGRIKDVIIIYGENHYPQDIEQTVQDADPSIRLGGIGAFPVTIDGVERLVVVAEVERRSEDRRKASDDGTPPGVTPRGPDRRQDDVEWWAQAPMRFETERIIRAIRASVAARHELSAFRIVLTRPGGVPKTSSGKIQRQRLKQSFLDGELEVIAEG